MINEADLNAQQTLPLSSDIQGLAAGQWLKLNNQIAPQLKLSTSESHPFVCIQRKDDQVTLVILTTARGLVFEDYSMVGDILGTGRSSYVNVNAFTVSLSSVQQHKQSKPKKLSPTNFSTVQKVLE